MFSIAVLLLCTFSLNASIRFENIKLEKALSKAKSSDKLIFIDTYAAWCAPCKIMDKVFKEHEVASFFNENFINVKIDMDGPYGEEILKKYGVVWLPTLLIINQDGEVQSKIDRLVSGPDLLSYAKDAVRGINNLPVSTLNNSPFSESGDEIGEPAYEDYNPKDKEEVLYVFDARMSSGRPHIMYHEAYLHLQLMDGKHDEVVQKYLSTQEDWSTEKNLKFIFDFLSDVNSELFKYFINNKGLFEKEFGTDRVNENLSFIVNERLEHGFPRPSLSETIRLFSYLDPSSAAERAYSFFLNKRLTEGLILEYIKVASDYIKNVNPNNHEVLYQLVAIRSSRSDATKHASEDLSLIKQAIALHDTNSEYHYTQAVVLFNLDKKNAAQESLNQAFILGASSDSATSRFEKLKQRIANL